MQSVVFPTLLNYNDIAIYKLFNSNNLQFQEGIL